MKKNGHITGFYLETLLLIVVFIAIILVLTQVFGLAQVQSVRAKQLTEAVTLAGNAAEPQPFPIALAAPFPKPSRLTRFLRGRLDLSDGTARLALSADQGNIVISSAIECNVLAEVPAGSGPLPAGTVLKGFPL